MNFSENTNLMPGGQSASPSKLKELDNKIDDLAQTVTSVADSVADLSDEVTTAELNANTANITNAVIDNATVGTETATEVNADTVNADNLNATDGSVTNLTADDVEANSVDADNGYFGSVNAQSFTGQGINITGDITASNKLQSKTVQATEKVVTPALESTTTELKGATTVRGDVYFPENGDKIYGEYLEIEADKVKADIEADTVNATSVTAGSVTATGVATQGLLVMGNSRFMGEVQARDIVPEPGQTLDITTDTLDADSIETDTVKVNTLTSTTPTGSSQLVGYDNNGNLIPVNAGFDPSNYWELAPDDQTTIQTKDNKKILVKGATVDGDLTVNGDIIQNGSAYETHAEKVYSKNDLIITRDGAVSGLSTGQYTGIQAKKYDGTNDGQLVFDKDGEARVGDVGDTEPLMTRDELADMTNGSLLQWDGINKKAVCGPSADIIPSNATTSNKLATGNSVNTALANYHKIILTNNAVPSYYRYILLQPTANGFTRNASFTFDIFLRRGGISNSKNIKIDFMASYDTVDRQCIVQCGISNEQSSLNYAKIVKVTYNDTEYFALKVYVYDYSQTQIYYTPSIQEYTSALLYKVLTPEEVTEGATVTYTVMFLNGQKIVTETYTKLTAAGNVGVNLSGVTYNELVVEIETTNASFTFHILKDMLTTSAKYFRDGYYSSATSGLCTVSAQTTGISLATLLINNIDEKANATINVYYR